MDRMIPIKTGDSSEVKYFLVDDSDEIGWLADDAAKAFGYDGEDCAHTLQFVSHLYLRTEPISNLYISKSIVFTLVFTGIA